MKGIKSARPARLEKRDVLKEVSEKEFLAQIIELAQLKGWLVYHVFEQRQYARRIGAGFPDLALCRPPYLLFIEVKSQKGVVSVEQREWITAINKCLVYSAGECRPSDWDRLVELLTFKEVPR